jgi:DNA-directed RNA polymerase subunit RPC12/RpoP
MLPPNTGEAVPSSPQSLTATERICCSHCQTKMMLERISPGPIGFEQRLFECPRCNHVEISVIASDPFKSKAAGWLAGEPGTPG